jgi:hypothetical protein
MAILLPVFTGAACALQKRANHKILVAGNPALTQERVDDLFEFFEWILTAEFNADQRARFQMILVEGWKQDAALVEI